MTNTIELDHVSKQFRIYHEKRNSIFELVTGMFNRKSHFEHVTVLDDVTFTVKKGETLAIMGDNGSGKTTILKLISKIYRPDEGSIKTDGVIVPLLQLGIGFQPELTATDNIITYGVLLGFTKTWIKSKIPEILKYAELEKYADAKIKNFSSGMYTRLAFSTAIQVNPDILLVDEVLSVGDIAFQKKGLDSFHEFKKQGKTVIYVSHDPYSVLQISDRVMILKKGKIDRIGNPQETVDYYMKSSLNHG